MKTLLSMLLVVRSLAVVPAGITAPPAELAPRIVAEARRSGGTSAADGCAVSMVIRSDGFVSVIGPGLRTSPNWITSEDAASFVALVESTDVDPRRLRRLKGTCPRGKQSTTYVLRRRAGTRVYDPCRVVLPPLPVFREMDLLLG